MPSAGPAAQAAAGSRQHQGHIQSLLRQHRGLTWALLGAGGWPAGPPAPGSCTCCAALTCTGTSGSACCRGCAPALPASAARNVWPAAAQTAAAKQPQAWDLARPAEWDPGQAANLCLAGHGRLAPCSSWSGSCRGGSRQLHLLCGSRLRKCMCQRRVSVTVCTGLQWPGMPDMHAAGALLRGRWVSPPARGWAAEAGPQQRVCWLLQVPGKLLAWSLLRSQAAVPAAQRAPARRVRVSCTLQSPGDIAWRVAAGLERHHDDSLLRLCLGCDAGQWGSLGQRQRPCRTCIHHCRLPNVSCTCPREPSPPTAASCAQGACLPPRMLDRAPRQAAQAAACLEEPGSRALLMCVTQPSCRLPHTWALDGTGGCPAGAGCRGCAGAPGSIEPCRDARPVLPAQWQHQVLRPCCWSVCVGPAACSPLGAPPGPGAHCPLLHQAACRRWGWDCTCMHCLQHRQEPTALYDALVSQRCWTSLQRPWRPAHCAAGAQAGWTAGVRAQAWPPCAAQALHDVSALQVHLKRPHLWRCWERSLAGWTAGARTQTWLPSAGAARRAAQMGCQAGQLPQSC